MKLSVDCEYKVVQFSTNFAPSGATGTNFEIIINICFLIVI